MRSETKHARCGGVRIAYQVVGEGGPDLLLVTGWVSHLDDVWGEPRRARFLRRLASFSRLILFDHRGLGLSDRPAAPPTLAQRLDEVRAVLDAVGVERAALMGVAAGGPTCALFAATYPERTAALVLFGAYARRRRQPDYPWAPSDDEHQRSFDAIEHGWGSPVDLATLAPSVAADEEFRSSWATYLRRSASPQEARALAQINIEIDIRHHLPAIRVPTLILHRTGDLEVSVGNGRYLAERIEGAKYVELPGDDHLFFAGDHDAMLDEIEFFLTGAGTGPEVQRVLTTVLFTEIAGATEIAASLDTHRWREIVDRYRAVGRAQLARFQGRAVRAYDAFSLDTFDSPTRAILCAGAIREELRQVGIELRAGLHTGECDIVGEDIGGIAVHICARVISHAGPGDIVVSNTVKDLVIGSGIQFGEVSAHLFTSLPGEWRLFRVLRGGPPTGPAPPITVPWEVAGRSAVSLSRRERQIATLLALGLTNRQVAAELAISVATAERHVANMLGKLGYHSRAQVAAWAVEQGLIGDRLG